MDLTKESTDVLWRMYRHQRRTEVRNELINRWASLVQKHARRLARRLSAKVSVGEIASAAFDGLMDAIEGFDPDRKIKFETFAGKRIVGAVHDWLRSIDQQSRTLRDFQKHREAAATAVSSDRGRRACPTEVAEEMGISRRQYESYLGLIRSGTPISLNALEQEDRHDPDGRGLEIPDRRQPPPYGAMEENMVRSYITRGLRERERHLIYLYYFDELTMAEVGNVLGMSESRVSQLHKNVLSTLRRRFASRQEIRLVM